MTPELINDREVEIQDFASDIVNLQEKRFGPRGDMIIQRSKLIQPVQDQVMSVVKLIAEEKNMTLFLIDLLMLLCYIPQKITILATW